MNKGFNLYLQWGAMFGACVGMVALSEQLLMIGFIVTFIGCFLGGIFAFNHKIWAYVTLDVIMGASAVNGVIGLL